MKFCRMCSGNGIIMLYPGNMKAPCLECSPNKRLSELEEAKYQKERGYALELERRQIAIHNERMANSPTTTIGEKDG